MQINRVETFASTREGGVLVASSFTDYYPRFFTPWVVPTAGIICHDCFIRHEYAVYAGYQAQALIFSKITNHFGVWVITFTRIDT